MAANTVHDPPFWPLTRCRWTREGALVNRRWIILVVAIFTLGSVATACGDGDDSTAEPSPNASEPVEVVFIYENPSETVGWEAIFEEARLALEEEFGDQIVTKFLDGVPASPEGRSVIEREAAKGPDVIIGTSFGHGEFMQELAPEYPDVHFIVSQFEVPEGVENFSGYDLRVEDGWYLSGVAAGMVAATTGQKVVGWIDGFAIPFELRQINGFALGYQEVVPDGKVQVVLINSWYDPQAAAQASNGLVDAGSGIIASGLSDPTVGEIAEQRNVPYSAVYPLTTFTPNSGVTGPRFHWEAFFAPKIQSIIDGTWEPTFDYFGAKEGAVGVAPFEQAFTENVSPDQVEEYEQIAQALEEGEFVVLPGTTEELTTLNYVVPGVAGLDLEVREISPPSGT